MKTENSIALSAARNVLSFTIPLPPLDGEYLWRFAGGQTLVSLEEAGDETETLRNKIDALIADPATPWEACDEEDKEYINDTLKGWGIGE